MQTGVSKSRHGGVSGHDIRVRSMWRSSRGKKSTSPTWDAVYKDGELVVLPAGIFGVGTWVAEQSTGHSELQTHAREGIARRTSPASAH
ncbi:hypothetical protein KI387_041956, partial [Taxus chinensis]